MQSKNPGMGSNPNWKGVEFENRGQSDNQYLFIQPNRTCDQIQNKMFQDKQSSLRKHNYYGEESSIFDGSMVVLTVLVLAFLCVLVVLVTFTLMYMNGAPTKQITILILCVGDHQKSLQSINSLRSFSSSGYRFIVGLNQPMLDLYLKKGIHRRYTKFVLTNSKMYTLQFLDKMIKEVDTQYFFFTTSQWNYKTDYFLKFSKSLLDQISQIGQVFPDEFEKMIRSPNFENSFGFSFSPGLHRTSDYQKMGSFSEIANKDDILNLQVEKKISEFYLKKGRRAIVTNKFKVIRIQPGNFFAQPGKNAWKTQQPKYSEPVINPQPIVPAQPVKRAEKVYQYINNIMPKLSQAISIFEIQTLKTIKQLPFCLILAQQREKHRTKIIQSINNISYSNFIFLDPAFNDYSNPQQSFYFDDHQTLMRENCTFNSLIMFVNQPLKHDALSKLNQLHQKHLAWITYSNHDQNITVHSFFYRIYELLGRNDFSKTNMKYLTMNNRIVHTIGFLELCIDSNKKISNEEVLQGFGQAFFTVFKNDNTTVIRQQYTKIHRLSQDMSIPIWNFQNRKRTMRTFSPNGALQLSANNMIRASQRQQQWYLPQNHSITEVQFQEYHKKFKIGDYMSKENQVRFCITILSHNNIQNDRYKKVIDTIVQQKYQNYHIVFIDDDSSDDNMNGTIYYLKQLNFPKQRLKFIQNKRRNFATYNIINGAFNFCHQDDVQMLMDGDDQFIGKYAFQVMNSAYQQNPDLWVAYSNYKTNYYEYGRSKRFYNEFNHANNGKRLYISNIGPIRTWKVKLIYQIPPLHHKMLNGEWLDTVYDDALQHPLLELSTVQRVRYINQILYDYNVRYGDNDDSTSEKVRHRSQVYRYIIGLNPLEPLKSLNTSTPNQDIVNQLTKDKDVRYTVLEGIY